jgi:hypothetical protein
MNLQQGRCWLMCLLITCLTLAMSPFAITSAASDSPDETSAAKPAHAEAAPDAGDDDEVDAGKDNNEQSEGNAEPAEEPRPLTEQEMLIREAKALLDELRRLRLELAETQLEKAEMERELTELRQFLEDHREYGRDFEEYQRVREIKRREQLERERREARERYERERRQRLERQEAVREMRAERRAAERQEREFRRHGFEPVGLDIFVGRFAYQYRIRDTLRTRITYDPFFGFFTQRDYRDRIDFTEMTISGAVINASNEVRNIGIAITFFDNFGNQVGHEIIQVNYARPNVPYPFTSTVAMALDRPFTTSSSYVLYADRADLE